MSQVFIHPGTCLNDVFEGRVAKLPVVLCEDRAPLAAHPELVPLLHQKHLSLYQKSVKSPLYIGMLPSSSPCDITGVTLPHRDTWQQALQSAKPTLCAHQVYLPPLEFTSFTRSELIDYIASGFLKILRMESDIDFTDMSVYFHGVKDQGVMFYVEASLDVVARRTQHMPRDRDGSLLVSCIIEVI